MKSSSLKASECILGSLDASLYKGVTLIFLGQYRSKPSYLAALKMHPLLSSGGSAQTGLSQGHTDCFWQH